MSLNCKFEFRLNCKQRLMFQQGTVNDNKFMSVDASQFCLCRNPTSCLLSMNKSAHRRMFCNESVKHDKLVGLTHSRVKTDIELIISLVFSAWKHIKSVAENMWIRQKKSVRVTTTLSLIWIGFINSNNDLDFLKFLVNWKHRKYTGCTICKWAMQTNGAITNYQKYSLLAEVSHDEAKWNDRRETSAGFRRVVWWSRRPNFWSKLTGFQNRFRLMCNARALLDWTLIIIEPTVDYGFREFRNLSLWWSHKIVCFYAWW